MAGAGGRPPPFGKRSSHNPKGHSPLGPAPRPKHGPAAALRPHLMRRCIPISLILAVGVNCRLRNDLWGVARALASAALNRGAISEPHTGRLLKVQATRHVANRVRMLGYRARLIRSTLLLSPLDFRGLRV